MSDAEPEWYPRYRTEVARLLGRLGASQVEPPTLARPMDEGHFVRGADVPELVFVERGRESSQFFTDVDALLFEVVRGATFAMAVRYELAHRRRGEDGRRQIFAHQLELLCRVGPEWVARGRARQEAILSEHPFDDALARRADRWGELMLAGMTREEAVAQATREHPVDETNG